MCITVDFLTICVKMSWICKSNAETKQMKVL